VEEIAMRRVPSSIAIALAGLALVVPVSVASTPSAASAAGAASDANAWRAISRPICGAPAPHHFACLSWIVTNAAGATRTSAVSPPPGSLSPTDLHTAYNEPTTTPVPETIAIVDAFKNPNVVSDLNTYNAQFNLPAFPTCTTAGQTACIAVMNQNGAIAPLPAEDLGWAVEIDLDVQAAHAMCQNCRINLYEANSASSIDLDIAENTAVKQGAQIVSNSFGSPGQCNDPAFTHPNVAVIASSGDSGSGRQCPAIMNTVISIGGTTLPRTPTGFGPETVWSGTGSGCALTIGAQPWQTAEATFAANCGTLRGSNDVSAVANPATGAAVFDSRPDPMFPGGPPLNWIQVGGTSLSAPLIAGIYGLGHGANSWPVPSQSVYASSSGFTDVTSGTNGPCNPVIQCTAAAGYDLPTGVGTPNGLAGFGASTADTTKPTITSAPALGLIVPSVLGKASTRIAWAATDGTGLGVAGYRLQHSIDGGVTWIGDGQTTATSKAVSLVIGTQVRYRVNAIDFAANTSPFVVGTAITPQLRQDSATTTVTYTGTWSTAAQAAASGGGVHFTTALNASASTTFTGRAVELVTAVGPGRGIVAVSIDGGAATTINLAAATLAWKAIRFGRLLAVNGSHTITIRNTTGGKRIALDAILFFQ